MQGNLRAAIAATQRACESHSEKPSFWRKRYNPEYARLRWRSRFSTSIKWISRCTKSSRSWATMSGTAAQSSESDMRVHLSISSLMVVIATPYLVYG